MAIIRVKPGVVTAQDGTYPELRGSRKGGLVAQDCAGRYEESTYRGNTYTCSTAGGGLATAATQLFSTAIATFTPILAIYNPLISKVNLSVLQVYSGLSAAPLATAAQTGAYLLVCGAGQSITNAQTATPVNNFTLKASGSGAVGITGVALTGAVGNATVLRPCVGLINVVTAAANVTVMPGAINCDNIDGNIIVPPGGYLGIAMGISNAVGSTFTTAGITWEEIPL
jgi:hypothetical protein